MFDIMDGEPQVEDGVVTHCKMDQHGISFGYIFESARMERVDEWSASFETKMTRRYSHTSP